MRQIVVVALVILVSLFAVACGEPEPEGPPTFTEYPPVAVEPIRSYSVILSTNMGRMTFKLLPEEALMAVNSFVFLVGQGLYDGMTFYRLVPGVLTETGDPTGAGSGNAGYTYEAEPPQRPYNKGSLVMGRDDSTNTNGSRFFIVLDDLTESELAAGHTVFGHLKVDHLPSARTLDKISSVEVGVGPSGEVNVPQEAIEILEAKITESCLPTMGIYNRC